MENKWPEPCIYGKSGVCVPKQLQKNRCQQMKASKAFRISKQLCTSVHLQKPFTFSKFSEVTKYLLL